MKIVTDSASDLRPGEASSLGIAVAPLQINFPEGVKSSDELTPDEFYTHLRQMEPQIPTTSQPSAGVFSRLYRKLAETGEEILSIHISSGLSGTIEAARMGAQEVPEASISHVDTLTLSGGQRFQVMAATFGVRAGYGKAAVLERLRQIQEASETIFTLETLTYLARGGRIGRVQAVAGLLLKIKPVIAVDKQDGKYNNVGKERTLKKAMEVIVSNLANKYGRTALWVSVMHGQFAEEAETLSNMLRERLNVGYLEILRVSPVLGVHTGPGVVGTAVVPLSLMDWVEKA